MSLCQIAERIRPAVDRYQAAFPALLEIPSKEHPYGTLPTTRCAVGMTDGQIPQRTPFSSECRSCAVTRLARVPCLQRPMHLVQYTLQRSYSTRQFRNVFRIVLDFALYCCSSSTTSRLNSSSFRLRPLTSPSIALHAISSWTVAPTRSCHLPSSLVKCVPFSS